MLHVLKLSQDILSHFVLNGRNLAVTASNSSMVILLLPKRQTVFSKTLEQSWKDLKTFLTESRVPVSMENISDNVIC